MYIDFSLKLRNVVIPKTITRTSVYAIVTRRSLLGFHKKVQHPQYDPSCTKTALLLFTEKNDAKDIVSILETSQKNIVQFSRDFSDEDYSSAKIRNSLNFKILKDDYADSIKPISTEIIPYQHLEKLCLLHYFDMLIVDNMEIMQTNKNEYDINLDCYHYKTLELPSRSVQEKFFRDMLYIN